MSPLKSPNGFRIAKNSCAFKSEDMKAEEFFRSPSAQDFFRELRNEYLKAQRPADQVILDETDLCALLHISKRHAADLRREGKIRYSKDGGKLFYKLSWALEYIDNYRVDPPSNFIASKKISA